jgi:hypothetical protein
MNRHAAAGFVATVAILVPAGWHTLGANIEKDGKHYRPMQQKLDVDGVTVTLDVDRAVVMTGDTVTAKLVAASDTPKDVKVDLRALHSTNYSGERVERPWQQIDRETITLHAAPGGGKAVTTRIKLGDKPDELALEDSFKIMVNKHGMKPEVREFDAGGKQPDYDALGGDDGLSAAGVFIRGWSGNSLGMKIEPKGPITADAPFTIAVTIKNTTGHKLEQQPWINLTTSDELQGTEDDEGLRTLDIESVDRDADGDTDADGMPKPLKKNGTITQLFTVTPHGKLPKQIAFLATATENDGLGPHGAGAMDIVTFDVTDKSPTVAVK